MTLLLCWAVATSAELYLTLEENGTILHELTVGSC